MRRVILGTAALETPELVDELVAAHGGAGVVVSLDAKDGFVTTRGWVHTTEQRVADVATSLAERVWSGSSYTDVGRDGMGEGTDLTGMRELLALDVVDVIASGGIGQLDDIQALVDLADPRLDGVIVARRSTRARSRAGCLARRRRGRVTSPPRSLRNSMHLKRVIPCLDVKKVASSKA